MPSVPIQSAVLEFDDDGNMKTADQNGGGGSTSDTATHAVFTLQSNTTKKLLSANPDRKGFIIQYPPGAGTAYLLYGGVDGSGNPIAIGQPGAVGQSSQTGTLFAGQTWVNETVVWMGAITCLGPAGVIVNVTELT